MIEFIATTLSVFSRFIFLYLIYTNKSKNTISLLFSIMSILSGSCWFYVFSKGNNILLLTRTCVELFTSLISCLYIIKNKLD